MTAFFFLLVAICAEEDYNRLVQGIKTAYDTNRAAFRHGVVEFEYSVGEAKTVEEAFRDDWKPKATAKGFYVFHGANVRHEVVFDYKDCIGDMTVISENSYAFGLVGSTRYLTNGPLLLTDRLGCAPKRSKYSHTAQINVPDEHLVNHNVVPFNIGMKADQYDLGSHIESAIKAPSPTWKLHRVDENAVMEGKKYVLIAFQDLKFTHTYWVDMENYGLPRRFTSGLEGEKVEFAVSWDKPTLFENAGWLPLVRSVFNHGNVKKCRITKADFRNPPDRKLFSLEFPEPVPMRDLVTMARYESRKVWSLLELPKPGSSEYRKIVRATTTVPAPFPKDYPVQKTTSIWSWLPWAITFIVGLFVIGFTAWQAMRKR